MDKMSENEQNKSFTQDNHNHNLPYISNNRSACNENNQQSPNKTINNHHYEINCLNLQNPNEEQAQKRAKAIKKVKAKKRQRDKSDHGANFIAPDGGWGWLVAIASGINVLVAFSSTQNFGIIYRERMISLGINSSELTTIINIEIAMSTFSGLLNGPMFRRYTIRQIALMGSVLIFLGIFLTIFANSFIFYICTFSILYGFGRGVIISASSMAVFTYFDQKRRTATAYQFGVAGLGPICLSYLATFLMQFFGMQGTVLIFSGISLHTFACALIFQPVKWHVKKPKQKTKEHKIEPAAETDENHERCMGIEKQQKLPLHKKIIVFFDLDLLLDISYITLAFGLTLVNFVESNFAILTPIILADFGFTNNQIANAMSLLGFSDLTIRFLIPFITSKLSFGNKTYFSCAVIGMSLGRIVLTVTRNFYVMLGVFLWMGLVKAFRIIFFSLLLADCVPLKRLPAARGLQLMMSTIFSVAVGPLIGFIRDKTNYAFALNFLNGLCFLAIFILLLEALWRKYQVKKKASGAEN